METDVEVIRWNEYDRNGMVRHEVPTAIFLSIQVIWDKTLYR